MSASHFYWFQRISKDLEESSFCFLFPQKPDPDDYATRNESLTFGPDLGRQCVNITIENDGLLEGLETLEANLLNNPSFIDLEPETTLIRIIDDDGEVK